MLTYSATHSRVNCVTCKIIRTETAHPVNTGTAYTHTHTHTHTHVRARSEHVLEKTENKRRQQYSQNVCAVKLEKGVQILS
jgi:hypothetical protein